MEFEKHTGIFSTSGDVASALSTGAINKPYMAIVGNEMDWNTQTPPIDYSKMYFTIEALSAGTIEFMKEGTGSSVVLDYSVDDGVSWTTFTSTTAGTQIQVAAGDKVMFRGENSAFKLSNTYNHFWSGSTAVYEVYGNTMSLLYGDDFQDKTTISNYAFQRLFYGCLTLISASNLILPATSLKHNCYNSMFAGCTSLTVAPELPATTLDNFCYGSMFAGCTSLTTAPELPATTLAQQSYQYMFSGCTSLTTAPELPATTIAPNCYGSMFLGCTSLTTAPELPATGLWASCYKSMFSGCSLVSGITCLATDIPATSCTSNWLAGVSPTGVFYKHPDMNDWTTGVNGIPDGWTVVDYTTEGSRNITFRYKRL